MKVFLLHRDRDFEPNPELRDPIFEVMASGNLHAITHVRRHMERQQRSVPPLLPPQPLVQDLELETLWGWMADGDEFLFEMAKRVLLSSLHGPEEIVYRQQVLADCLEHPATIAETYRLAIQGLACERQAGSLWSGAGPGVILHRSVRLLKLYVDVLRRLTELAEGQGAGFTSAGFTRFFAMVRKELSDEYLNIVEDHLSVLELKHGLLESAELGQGDNGRQYIFHEPPRQATWRERLPLLGGPRHEEYSFELHPRDEPGARYLETVRGRGINHVADALARSADHVHSFFTMLRLELAFYLGCLNLNKGLDEKGEPVCFPEPVEEGQLALTAEGIYDVSLTLHLPDRMVGNDIAGDGKSLVIVTGANQGGKSTLLRGLGLAQLMMQAGMFVGARSFRANVCRGVFTHYKREEDPAMEGGKLDEELARMSAIADQIKPGSVLLCNESFAATNEREGSEIARQVIRAMLDKQIKVVFVTHMYDFAHSVYVRRFETALFLRAERKPDGSRSFKLSQGEPLATSHGEDSYLRIFGTADAASVEALG